MAICYRNEVIWIKVYVISIKVYAFKFYLLRLIELGYSAILDKPFVNFGKKLEFGEGRRKSFIRFSLLILLLGAFGIKYNTKLCISDYVNNY